MNAERESESSHPWLRGAVISGVGVAIGAIAFILFCYSLGLNLSDQGWPENRNPWESNRNVLIGSFVGFAVAILLFWFGFYHATRSRC